MGKVIMSGIVPQLEAPLKVDPVFANNDWATIIEACQKNKVPETWVVGDQKAMQNKNGVTYQIDIIGKGHDDYSDGSGKAPLTFQLHSVFEVALGMNTSATNAGGWEASNMRTVQLPLYMEDRLTDEIQAAIREVNKLTTASGTDSTIVTTADKLFLLSEIEFFGKCTNSFAGEGTQYAYYAAGNPTAKCQVNTTTYRFHWTRSSYKNNSAQFCAVYGNESGQTYHIGAAQGYYPAFAFCF